MSSGDYEIAVKCTRCRKMTPIGDIPHICSACDEKENGASIVKDAYPVSIQKCVGETGAAGIRYRIAFERDTKLVIKCKNCSHYHGVYTSYMHNGQLFLEILPCPHCLNELYEAQREAEEQEPCACDQISTIIGNKGDTFSADAIVTLIDELLTARNDDLVDDKILEILGRVFQELSNTSWARTQAGVILRNHFSNSEVTAEEAVEEIKTILKAVERGK